ncbi:MAG TPA: LacI family DNA-binding transcriptional regulator [Capillimicrobium sp.]|nr:LacI family DNA-binding transcriptional regulator [Capillimicrobium sp.]
MNGESDWPPAGSTSRARRPSMRDVAERAGVSIKTVSRVVNGEGHVSAQLSARVREAIAELDYRPDPAASILRRADGRTSTVAVILEDLANPFSAAVHRAIVTTMRERDVLVLSADSDEDPAGEREAFLAFIDRRVDGVILMPTSSDHAWMRSARVGHRHVVMVDRPAPGFPSDVVVTDNDGGARRGTSHLVRQGHERVAFLGADPALHTAGERLAGYRTALEAAGVRRSERLERTGLRDSEQARDAVIDLLTGERPPTAIFASQNRMTVGALVALRQLGLHRRVALVGFDDIELADVVEPGVTVVAQAPPEIGRAAAELLLARIGGDTSAPRTELVPTRLIPRGSGELPPPDGPPAP